MKYCVKAIWKGRILAEARFECESQEECERLMMVVSLGRDAGIWGLKINVDSDDFCPPRKERIPQ